MRLWTYSAAYGFALLWPLVFIAMSDAGSDLGAARVASDAIAFVALNALTLQLVVPSRLRGFTGSFGVQRLLRFHRLMGTTALAFVLVHIALLFVDDASATAALFDVASAHGAARAGLVALVALVLIDVSSRARVRAMFAYERWRLVHIVLAIVVPTASYVHVVLVARFSDDPALKWGSFVMVAVAVCCVFYLRIARPYGGGWLPYRVREVRPDGSAAVSLVLEPDGHDGLSFTPGQFAWLKFADARYSLREHPFSIASSAARADALSFTIRTNGDFTGTVTDIAPGTRVLVDGPHGAWRPEPGTTVTYVAGGVGVTPALSACATALDGGVAQPTQVVAGCRTVADLIGGDLLEAARQLPDVDVFVVPTDPPPGWSGAHGYLGREVLQHLPGAPIADRSWFVCGPPQMTRLVRSALLELGVAPRRIHVESF